MGYIDDHPTSFTWEPRVREVVRQLRARWDADTYVNTYWWHPPYDPPVITERYDSRSFDVWGPDGRGDPLDPVLGDKIWKWLFSNESPGQIHWIIYKGKMWISGYGGQKPRGGRRILTHGTTGTST